MILAQSTSGPAPRYEFATLGPWSDEPGALLAAACVGLVLLAAVALFYWRERASLSPAAILPLLVLRLGAVVGVVVYGLAPEKRDAREETQPSRVLMIVDNSLSMSMSDSSESTANASRAETAVALLGGGLLDTLRAEHEVHVAPSSDLRGGVVLPLLDASGDAQASQQTEEPPDFATMLAPRAAESRLGDAIEQGLAVSAGRALAGLVMISDGQNNAGASPELVSAVAGDAGTPIFTIGTGSESVAKNLAVRDLIAPRRAYPKDEIQLTAVIEQQGFDAANASASLFVRPAAAAAASEQLLDAQPIESLSPDAPLTLQFTARPEEPGSYVYRVSVRPLAGEINEEDNSATAEVQVVDRLLKVLVVAGGPTRDYHFLRDQLRRDDSFAADVWLQSAPNAAVQDADNVLREIPADEEKLGEYDLFVALDADWTRVPRQTIDAIERCIAERGAGMLFATGPVNTPRWLRDGDAQGVLSLLPVRPAAAPLLLGPTERSSPTPSRIELTRAGEQAPPLWVLGDQQASTAFWEDQLPGFYTTAEVDAVKPGAVVYAEAASNEAATDKPLVVFAEQFFGAGRCFYIGAPEVWRLRTESTAAMRAFYTKLLQHLSQGRLLADSPAGSLLFERDRYNVGETLTLRATLTDSAASEIANQGSLTARLELPDASVQSVPLSNSGAAPHIWTGSLRADREGAYHATVDIAAVGDPLTAKTQVLVPALERSRTQRNTALLTEVAAQSGGRYYPSTEAVLSGGDDLPPLAELLVSRSETMIVYGAPDEQFSKMAARWLLGLIAGCLLLEWATRRVLGLA
ncbi:hypothetical protein KOR34_04600 [Posidoniimonas corsicana]|uniref:VWFA domain-containing protein n=1 Tax=Posidoniimonas corsicana TaxID=1938618 RepID=A0A5C5VC78_9BACT|nr:hypothetical protein [Posidoniimonas corsicana]TWT35567.1 hypothetical protein KOR34_04600 [Posidoniimonas corsicana]